VIAIKASRENNTKELDTMAFENIRLVNNTLLIWIITIALSLQHRIGHIGKLRGRPTITMNNDSTITLPDILIKRQTPKFAPTCADVAGT
jgi:hypothetical protein